MEKEFVPYELALKLKELGFDEGCCAWWCTRDYNSLEWDFNTNNCGWLKGKVCSAPLWQQAFDWFREKYNLYIPIRGVVGNEGTSLEEIYWTITGSPWDRISTYQEARQACLEKLIELCQTS